MEGLSISISTIGISTIGISPISISGSTPFHVALPFPPGRWGGGEDFDGGDALTFGVALHFAEEFGSQ